MLPAPLPKAAAVRRPVRPGKRRLVPTLAWAVLAALALHGVVLGSLPLGSTVAVPNRAPALSLRTVAAAVPSTPLEAALPAGSALFETAPLAVQTPPLPLVAGPARPVSPRSGAAPPLVKVERPRQPQPGVELAMSSDPSPDLPGPVTTKAEPVPSIEADPAWQLLAAAGAERTGSTMAQGAATGSSPAAAARDDDQVDAASVPLYRTSFPASQTLRYDLRRGMLSGNGELRWQRDPPGQAGSRYELQLEARIGSMVLLTQFSTGGFDQAGLAPVRFTDRRLRSSARAANFQRQRAIISFSGAPVEYPLLRGTQDRLSWMMQLPAILAASPRLASAGEKVTLYVIGARGDAALWDFRFAGRERLSTDAGPVEAVKFVREPRKPHDTTAEVWLDPAQHYLPVRARIGNPDDGAMLELTRAGS